MRDEEFSLLLAEEMGYDEMLDSLTGDEVYARIVECECSEDEEWEDVPY